MAEGRACEEGGKFHGCVGWGYLCISPRSPWRVKSGGGGRFRMWNGRNALAVLVSHLAFAIMFITQLRSH
ncbi:hypothetical protein [Rubritalea tangerina]|uniref:hypothetical protein n=1 Tax=Rubritalea tangerina TaxID=430798 RepID=UPI00361FB7AC